MKKDPSFTSRSSAQSYHTQSTTPELLMSYQPDQEIKTSPSCILSKCLLPAYNSRPKPHSTFWRLLLQPTVHPVATKVMYCAEDCAYHRDDCMTSPSYKFKINLNCLTLFYFLKKRLLNLILLTQAIEDALQQTDFPVS